MDNIDLIDPASFADGHPWGMYEWLRSNAPVYRHAEPDGPGFWALTRYDDIKAVSRQPRLFSSQEGGVFVTDSDPTQLEISRLMMLNMDPPRHDRFKLLVSGGFTPRAATALIPRVDALAAGIVDDVIERGECDLVTDLCGRLPSALIAELLGIPRADGERLYELTEIMHDAVSPIEQKMAAIGEMLGYAASVAQAKRADPADDIASILVQAEVDGERLTDDEFQWFTLLLVNAGGDTTRNLLAAGVELLFEHPDQHARLAADPDGLLASTVEEMLRAVSPVVCFRRTVMADTVIRGVDIAAGEKVVMFYGSANRDEDVFGDGANFDIGRSPNPHLAFGGGGPHLCLGLHLARIESVAMLRQIVSRLPDLHRRGPTERLVSSFIAGIRHLPVAFTPSTRGAGDR